MIATPRLILYYFLLSDSIKYNSTVDFRLLIILPRVSIILSISLKTDTLELTFKLMKAMRRLRVRISSQLLKIYDMTIPCTCTFLCQYQREFIYNSAYYNFLSNCQEMLQDSYTQNYIKFASAIAENGGQFLRNCILKLHPSKPLYGIDIGSCDGKLGNELMKINPNFNIVSVDISPTEQNVIKMDGLEYLKQLQHHVDFIILKFAAHFFNEEFYQLAKKKAKSVYILTLHPKTNYCWTKPIEKTFENSCFKAQSLKMFTDVKLIQRQQTKILDRQMLTNFLRTRSYSNLYNNTNEQLEEAISQLNEQNQCKIVYSLYIASS